MAHAEIEALLEDFVPGGAAVAAGRLRPGAAGRAVAAALSRYAKDRPDWEAGGEVPAADRLAVAALAASLLLEQLAVAAAGDTGSTILADSVDHGSVSDRYAARARAARRIYDDQIGGAPQGAASVALPARPGLLLRGGRA